jgi:ribonuclease D
MFADSISKDEITLLPKAVYNGIIQVVNTEEELKRWLPVLLKQKLIGFDTETKPTFKKGDLNTIALLQLATADIALLIRVKELGLPNQLIKVLESPTIIKIGAAIRDDIKSLLKIKKFNPEGFIDLQSVVPEYGIESLSVRKMAAIVLGKKVSKSQQLSNWDSPSLTEAQQQYAAIDAWACSEIYQKLITSKTKNDIHQSNS